MMLHLASEMDAPLAFLPVRVPRRQLVAGNTIASDESKRGLLQAGVGK